MSTEGTNEHSDDTGAAGDVQQQLADMQTKLTALESDNQTLKDTKDDLTKRLDNAEGELISDDYLNFKENAGNRTPSENKPTGDVHGFDFDRASNKELVDFIQTQYNNDTAAAVKDIKKELDISKQRIGLISAQFDVALAEMRHPGTDGKPGFKQNEKAIYAIAKANPSWKAEQCYKQFVLTAKADADTKVAEEKARKEEEARTATEKPGMPSSTSKGKNMSKEEAATSAYDAAFGTKE